MEKKLYVVRRPSMEKVTGIPTFNYTYANDKEEAISKVRMKYGEYDEDIIATEFNFNDDVVIGSNFFG